MEKTYIKKKQFMRVGVGKLVPRWGQGYNCYPQLGLGAGLKQGGRSGAGNA